MKTAEPVPSRLMALDSGTKLGRYEIRSKIGEGGMGEVSRARDEKLDRDVAVKVMLAALSENSDHANLYVTSASATGDDQLLLASDFDDIPTSWSRDGQSILFMRFASTSHVGVWLLPLSGDRQPRPFLQSAAFDQGSAIFSPNGSFIAYTSKESGRPEVYVQTFPLSGEKWTVSSGGGFLPLCGEMMGRNCST